MRKFFYARLALTNLKKNSKTYLPFLLTCIGTVIMFYNICALTFHGSIQVSTAAMMEMGMDIIAVFAVIFLFYTNSFLIKRRKKEFGLFNILGMEKKHIGRIMAWETFYAALISLFGGLLLGILFSKLITLFLYKLINFDPNIGFAVSGKGVLYTLVLFGGIFFLLLLNNLRHVHTANPIELLQGGNVGEKEPKTKWLIAVIGLIALGIGYYLALSTETPLQQSRFFTAVIAVIVGTYFLFTAGSIALLKLLKKNKAYYYQTKHFTTVSGMIYRMKQNAAGLASICVMSTMVVVMISTTVSMFIGVEDLLTNRFPKDFALTAQYTPEDHFEADAFSGQIKNVLADYPGKTDDYNAYTYLSFNTKRSNNHFSAGDNAYIKAADADDLAILVITTAADYQKETGKSLDLTDNQVAVYAESLSSVTDTIQVFDERFQIKKRLSQPITMGNPVAWQIDIVHLIVADENMLNRLYQAQSEVYGDHASSISYEVSFDLSLPESEKAAFSQSILVNKMYQTYFSEGKTSYETEYASKQLSRSSFYELYGGLFFLGIFLGALFLMATVLIIYYKQIVEGFDDKERYHIMQKVGMSKEEIKKSVHSQVLTIFALPLIVAAIHVTVAFPLFTKLLALLSLTNVPLFLKCTVFTILVFAVAYSLVYGLTARTYYKIINGESN
ncbi:MAG TPA: FtsX-like permease family protein [Clostridiales bacterium]|nr:FtsX-like permease family protein [Clostridiales bacterium]